jgi:hypothetical protein
MLEAQTIQLNRLRFQYKQKELRIVHMLMLLKANKRVAFKNSEINRIFLLLKPVRKQHM